MVLEEVDILLDRKGVLLVSYLSSGMGCSVHAAAVNSGQTLGTQWTEKEEVVEEEELLSICLTFEKQEASFFDVTETRATNYNYSKYAIPPSNGGGGGGALLARAHTFKMRLSMSVLLP
jgi:hypothetical protein